VPPDLAAEARGLLALGALLLLPGLVIVRAPWTAVPFLSAAFWIVSWWWGLPRLAFLHGAVVAFALLVLLRLFQPLPFAIIVCFRGLILSCQSQRQFTQCGKISFSKEIVECLFDLLDFIDFSLAQSRTKNVN